LGTLLYTHAACLKHDPGPQHPECPARLQAILEALEAPSFSTLDRREAPKATIDQIARVHDRDHVIRTLNIIEENGHAALDGDTHVSPGSDEAALRAAGAVCTAVDAVMAGAAKNAFCAVRPPGHHAECAVAMGFCLFNNVAVGAEHARKIHNLERVAVIDFDVHHGNGTQAMFWDDAGLFYGSTHQSPLYPGTGQGSDTGAAGNIVNAPLPPHAGSAEFRSAMETIILPELRRFEPEFLFISAGFDAHVDDPLAMLGFTDDDYRWATEKLCTVADELCHGRVVSTLEGGYDLNALARSTSAHVSALLAA
jgi:acetoin utilization deacetylase AcuC-like enzyme